MLINILLNISLVDMPSFNGCSYLFKHFPLYIYLYYTLSSIECVIYYFYVTVMFYFYNIFFCVIDFSIILVVHMDDLLYAYYLVMISYWQNTRIVYGTIVLYDYTRLSLGLDSTSLKCPNNRKKFCSEWKKVLKENHL